MNLGPAEILVILVLALLVFGPKRLPEVGRQVAGAMRELRRMQDSVKAELSTALADDPTSTPARAPAAASATTVAEEPDHADLPPPPDTDADTDAGAGAEVVGAPAPADLPPPDPSPGGEPAPGNPDGGFARAPETFS